MTEAYAIDAVTNDTSPVDASTTCLDDFFHVADDSPDPTESRGFTVGAPYLISGPEEHAEHAGGGMIYMLTHAAGPAPINEMDIFLTRVAAIRNSNDTDARSWVSSVIRKLRDIRITTVPMLLSEIHVVNKKLGDVGHTLLNDNTLDIMAHEAVRMRESLQQQGQAAAPEPPTEDDASMYLFLSKVARAKKVKSPETWITAVRHKFRKIGITSVRETVAEIIMLNRKLDDIGSSMMHYQTLDLMARHGVEVLLAPAPPAVVPSVASLPSPDPVPLVGSLPSPVLSLKSSDDKVGQCLACDGFGPAWNLCTTCVDSGMTYELIASTDDSHSSDVSSDLMGTCPDCTQTGILGEICSACDDSDVVYLNFHAGL
jgi:hypothetical protein